MSRTTRTIIALLLAAALSAALAATVGAQSFEFRKIVDSGQGLSPDGCPAVNDLGHVAFKAVDDEGSRRSTAPPRAAA
jgi:type 1 fimbria pilin